MTEVYERRQSWEEEVVPTLRRRLETESLHLTHRLSHLSTTPFPTSPSPTALSLSLPPSTTPPISATSTIIQITPSTPLSSSALQQQQQQMVSSHSRSPSSGTSRIPMPLNNRYAAPPGGSNGRRTPSPSASSTGGVGKSPTARARTKSTPTAYNPPTSKPPLPAGKKVSGMAPALPANSSSTTRIPISRQRSPASPAPSTLQPTKPRSGSTSSLSSSGIPRPRDRGGSRSTQGSRNGSVERVDLDGEKLILEERPPFVLSRDGSDSGGYASPRGWSSDGRSEDEEGGRERERKEQLQIAERGYDLTVGLSEEDLMDGLRRYEAGSSRGAGEGGYAWAVAGAEAGGGLKVRERAGSLASVGKGRPVVQAPGQRRGSGQEKKPTVEWDSNGRRITPNGAGKKGPVSPGKVGGAGGKPKGLGTPRSASAGNLDRLVLNPSPTNPTSKSNAQPTNTLTPSKSHSPKPAYATPRSVSQPLRLARQNSAPPLEGEDMELAFAIPQIQEYTPPKGARWDEMVIPTVARRMEKERWSVQQAAGGVMGREWEEVGKGRKVVGEFRTEEERRREEEEGEKGEVPTAPGMFGFKTKSRSPDLSTPPTPAPLEPNSAQPPSPQPQTPTSPPFSGYPKPTPVRFDNNYSRPSPPAGRAPLTHLQMQDLSGGQGGRWSEWDVEEPVAVDGKAGKGKKGKKEKDGHGSGCACVIM